VSVLNHSAQMMNTKRRAPKIKKKRNFILISM